MSMLILLFVLLAIIAVVGLPVVIAVALFIGLFFYKLIKLNG